MVQGYYTLEEAAQVLGMPAEELKQMGAKRVFAFATHGEHWFIGHI